MRKQREKSEIWPLRFDTVEKIPYLPRVKLAKLGRGEKSEVRGEKSEVIWKSAV